MKLLLSITMAFIIISSCFAQDWVKIENDYKAARAKEEAKGYPDYKKSQNQFGTIYYDARPELGVGMHSIDQNSLDMAKKINIRFIRLTMYWNYIEKTKVHGVYNQTALENYDKMFQLMKANDIIPVIVVHGNAPGSDFSNREDAYQRFTDFMIMAVKRWNYIKYWELWNEMDAGFTDLFGANVPNISKLEGGKYYADFLKICYPAIKKASPDSIIICGSVTNPNDFLEGIYKSGGKDFFDVVNIHTYGMPLQWGFFNNGIAAREMMKKYGDGEKPLWNTEFGVEAGGIVSAWGIKKEAPLDYFDKTQKEMISDCIALNKQAGIYTKYFIYQWMAGNEGENDKIMAANITFPNGYTINDYGYGIIRSDGITGKPIYNFLLENKANEKSLLIPKKVMIENKKISLKSNYPTLIK